jgi:NADH:ubiquinone oxidoreductase subunit B-like Fe-S oxidoreductase
MANDNDPHIPSCPPTCEALLFNAFTKGQQGEFKDQAAAAKAFWKTVHDEYHRLVDLATKKA